MKQFLCRVLVVLLLSPWVGTAPGQEIRLEYKAREAPLSYRLTQRATARAQDQREMRLQTIAVLREEKVTMNRDMLLLSEDALSYMDEQDQMTEKPTEPTGSIATVTRRDRRGKLYPEKGKEAEGPLIWPLLCAPRALPIFPADNVKIGETWTETVPIHSWLRTFDVLVTSKLEAVEDHLGYRCAKITYEFYGCWNLREDPDRGKRAIDLMRYSTEEIVGSGTLYFALDIGAIVEKEQHLKFVKDQHNKYWEEEGKIAMRVENYNEMAFDLDMEIQK